MRIIFESKNKKLQEPALLENNIQKTNNFSDFQKNILEYLFQNPKYKISETTMLGNKMALDVVKKGS
jgi:hypothetical protein